METKLKKKAEFLSVPRWETHGIKIRRWQKRDIAPEHRMNPS
jgi:hypothetical protein